MIINISNSTLCGIFHRIIEKENIHLLTAPVESVFFSKELSERAQQLGIIGKKEYPPQDERTRKDLLACDALYLAYELLDTYLKTNYVEASLTYNEDEKEVELKDIPYKGTFIEDFLEDINTNIQSLITDKQETYKNLIYTPNFYLKVLLFEDEEFYNLSTQLSIAGRLVFETHFLEATQIAVKEFEDVPLEDVLTDKAFEALIRKAEKMADRFKKLQPYKDELEDFHQFKLESVMFRPFLIMATDAEFKEIYNSLIGKRKKAHIPTNVTIAKPMFYTKAFSLFPDREPDLYKIHEDEKFKYYAKVMVTDSKGNPDSLDPIAHRDITACNELFKQNGYKPGTYSIRDYQNFRGYPGHPKEDLANCTQELMDLSSKFCWLLVVVRDKETGHKYELSKDNKEELEFFENCTGYNFTPLVRHWAMHIDHVISAGNFKFDGNQNGTESATFTIYDQPIMYRVAEEMKQVFSMPYAVLNTGNQFKSQLSEAIFNEINKQLSWDSCNNWTRNYKSFFGEDGLGFTKTELNTPRQKQKLLDALEKVLRHEYDCGNIKGFCIERRTGNFYFVPHPLAIEDTEKKEEKARKTKLNKTRKLETIKTQFKAKLKKAGCNFITQRVYPDLDFALKVEDKQGKEIKKPYKYYKNSKGIQGIMA